MLYSNLLKDPRWQKKRLEIMQRDGFSCVTCGETKETLNVHHRRYIKGSTPWDYPDSCLVTLCETCHTNEFELLEAEAFSYKNFTIPSEVYSAAFNWFFKNNGGGDFILSEYFNHLEAKRLIKNELDKTSF